MNDLNDLKPVLLSELNSTYELRAITRKVIVDRFYIDSDSLVTLRLFNGDFEHLICDYENEAIDDVVTFVKGWGGDLKLVLSKAIQKVLNVDEGTHHSIREHEANIEYIRGEVKAIERETKGDELEYDEQMMCLIESLTQSQLNSLAYHYLTQRSGFTTLMWRHIKTVR